MELLAKAMDKANFKSIFLPFYSKYLSDIEPEIRSIACLQLKSVCEAIETDDIVSKIFPNIKNITEDSCLYVRSKFASIQTLSRNLSLQFAPSSARSTHPITFCQSSCNSSKMKATKLECQCSRTSNPSAKHWALRHFRKQLSQQCSNLPPTRTGESGLTL